VAIKHTPRFVDANAGQENLLDATRLVVEMLPDYRLEIEREILQLVDFQIVDSGATMHLGPVDIATAMMAPVPPPAPYVPVINLADFLFDEEDDNEDDDAEPFESPPGGPSVWIAPAAPVLPIVPVLGLDAFLEDVDEPVQLLPASDSTSVLTGRSVREREVLIENVDIFHSTNRES
jgi:hypothetical protein